MFLNNAKTVLLLGLLTGLLLGIGQLFGGTNGMLVALGFAVLMNFAMYWWSSKIVLFMYRAKEASKHHYPKLHRMVEELAHDAGLPKPKLYIIPTQNPNAFATGRNPQHAVVACTEGILSLLSEAELRGVLGHELGHVKNRDILVTTVAATIAGAISMIASMARFAAIFGGSRDDRDGNLLAVLVLSILTPLIALLLQLAISRSREYLADATSARITKQPKHLASALRKLEAGAKHSPLHFGSPATSSLFIVNPFTTAGLLSLLSTHPPVAERVRRLEAMA
ncbi:zinc metalloprotease HtpX [Candidatus Woesearchaeota archaeon]|nr:zinc metalloprotease HtpX [Candidatus Woesearchaeota archaeon]